MNPDVHLSLDAISFFPGEIAEVEVRGWCWSPRSEIAALSLECEGRRAPCLTGIERLDVAAHFSDQRAAETGFLGRIRVTGESSAVQLVAIVDRNPQLLAPIAVPQIDPVRDYAKWIAACEPQLLRKNDDGLRDWPLLSIILSTANTPAFYLNRSIESVLRQRYPDWQLSVVAGASADLGTRRYLEDCECADDRIDIAFPFAAGVRGQFVIRMDAGDALHSSALLEVAACLNEHPEAALIYSDEDQIDDDGHRFNPAFKPAFNRDLLLAYNYMGRFVAIRRDLMDRVGGFRTEWGEAQDWDVLVRAAEIADANSIRHLAKPLYHRWGARDSTASKPDRALRKVLEDHAARTNQAASVHKGLFPGSMRLKPEPARLGRIAVICRSADGIHQYWAVRRTRGDEVTLYEVAQDTLRRTGVPNSEAVTLDELDGDFVVFVNSPVEYFNHAFFEELRLCAQRQDCGIAGPLVLDHHDNIVSAGTVWTSGGGTRDLFRGLPFSTTAQMGLAKVTRSVASISSCCFAVSKLRLVAVAGQAPIQEHGLTDLCERLIEAAHADGLEVLYTPYAVVVQADSDSAPPVDWNLETAASLPVVADEASLEPATGRSG